MKGGRVVFFFAWELYKKIIEKQRIISTKQLTKYLKFVNYEMREDVAEVDKQTSMEILHTFC